MKKIAIILSGVFIIALFAFNLPDTTETLETNGIEFNSESWKDIQKLAKEENKVIFLDISTSWCGYCKRMKAKVYTDAEVAKFYNSKFINVSVDAEKGEGIELAKKYGANAYPTFVFINPDGSLAMQTTGYKRSEKFIELGKSISNN